MLSQGDESLIYFGTSLILFFLTLLVSFIIYHQKRVMKKELEQRILNQNYQLKIIETKIQSQENERKQIAEDLHDDIAPFLLSVNMLVKIAKMKSVDEEQYDIHYKMEGMIDESILKIRKLSHTLHPAVLDAFGFKSAVEDMALKFKKTENILINYSFDSFEISFEHSKELALFRLLQELITNAIKHGGAKQFDILFIKNGENLFIDLIHNGGHYSNSDYQKDLKKNNGIGLLNIKERLEILNGTINYIINDLSKSAEIHLSIPLE